VRWERVADRGSGSGDQRERSPGRSEPAWPNPGKEVRTRRPKEARRLLGRPRYRCTPATIHGATSARHARRHPDEPPRDGRSDVPIAGAEPVPRHSRPHRAATPYRRQQTRSSRQTSPQRGRIRPSGSRNHAYETASPGLPQALTLLNSMSHSPDTQNSRTNSRPHVGRFLTHHGILARVSSPARTSPADGVRPPLRRCSRTCPRRLLPQHWCPPDSHPGPG